MLVIGVAGAACGFPNPRDCADGTCTDPSRPFCDEDGAISGFDQTCIAVSCTPKQVAACRGDQAITCNNTGTNYDLISCPLGCDLAAGGCRQCADDSQCDDPRPVCDASTGSCRGCRSDDECASKVCDSDAGVCVPESSVIYASPTGFGTCSLTQPCALKDAVTAARSFPGRPIIRMLPGTYQVPLEVSFATQMPIEVVATHATIALVDGSAAVAVSDGASVNVRGLSTTAAVQINCGKAGTVPAALQVRDSLFSTVGNMPVVSLVRCALELSSIDLAMNASEIAIGAADDTVLHGDRIHIHGNGGHHIVASGSRVFIQLTNSLFEDVGLDLNTTDTSAPGSNFVFASNTHVFLSSLLSQGCDNFAANRSVRYENSILASLGSQDTVSGTNCLFLSTILARQVIPLPGTIVVDPQFVDVGARDFHLKPQSPAIDAAVPSQLGLDSTHDLDGTPRPQGARRDIGAYERIP